MAIYNKVAKALVYDLINEANPALTKAVTEQNCLLGVPTVIAGAVFPAANSTITLSPAANTNDFIGRQTVKYRRLDLSRMFRGITVTVTKFSPLYASVGTNNVLWTLYALLPDINKLYGLKLTEDDLTNINILKSTLIENGQGYSTATIAVKATSLGFVGSFALKWVNTAQSIADMVTNADLDGRRFPGGNVFDANHKFVVSGLAYGLQVTGTSLLNYGNAYPTGMTPRQANGSYGGYFTDILLALNALPGKKYTWKFTTGAAVDAYKTAEGELFGMTVATYKLPDANFPEGNSRFYNYVFVITIPDDCPWACGQLIFHYNRAGV